MNRLAWIAVVALAGLTAIVVGDLLDPESVPVAQAVELSGTAPENRVLPEGFFIVPPRVVDFRDDTENRDDSGPAGTAAPGAATDDRSSDPDDDDRDDEDGVDVNTDDSADDSADEDDSVDDDD